MTNGTNSWHVSFSHIVWFQRLLEAHENVTSIDRHDDIIFEIERKAQKDHLRIMCCNDYTMGITNVHRALSEFGELNIIYIGGGWCGYTRQAKDFCLAQRIGLYVTDEMSGGLWKDAYWSHHGRDKDGNPTYHYTAA